MIIVERGEVGLWRIVGEVVCFDEKFWARARDRRFRTLIAGEPLCELDT